jgi:hypothetical protein
MISTLFRNTLAILLAFSIAGLLACSSSPPEVPIRVSYRHAAIGMGYVAIFDNTSDRFLSLRVSFHNPTINERARVRLDVAPRSRTEWGWLEGWSFASGDIILIEHADYASKKVVVP